MKFLIISARGEGLQLARRLESEEHSCTFLSLMEPQIGRGIVNLPEDNENGNGFVRMGIPAFSKYVHKIATKDTIIIFTSPGLGSAAEAFQKQGYLTFGAGLFHDSLWGSEEMRKNANLIHGIQNFSSEYDEAPSIVEGWFNGEEFIFPIWGAVQEYGFMAGDVGVPIECAGITAFAFTSFKPRLFTESIEKLAPMLRKVNYKGPISADLRGSTVVRYLCGFRFDLFHLQLGLLEQEAGQIFGNLARGLLNKIRFSHDYGVCIRATFPPFPHSLAEPDDSAALGDLSDLGNYALTGVRKDGDAFLPASHDGQLLCACGYGKSIKEAQASAFDKISLIPAKKLQFRVDIGALALRNISALLKQRQREEVGAIQE